MAGTPGRREQQINPEKGAVVSTHVPEDAVVSLPVKSDHAEAHDEAYEFRRQVSQLQHHIDVSVVALGQPELEHEECHRDGDDRIAEERKALEAETVV